MLERSVQFDLVQGDAGVNNGALLETLAAQELVANGYDLRYFDKSKYGEVDFVVPGEGKAVPLGVKSGSDYRKHKSLDNVMAVGEWGVDSAYVFCPAAEQHGGARSDPPVDSAAYTASIMRSDRVK